MSLQPFGIALLLLALLGAACGAGRSSNEVRPFGEVQASEFSFENDRNAADRGVFRVTTSEPMICSIAWGETEALGNLNNTLGMEGTGIIDHEVLLPGARAGATYFFKVQGSTADGTLYSTELLTFTLPERDGEPASAADALLGASLAAGASVVEVSSVFAESFAAENAIDGDPSTEWSTAGDGDEAFIEIELSGEETVRGVAFLTRAMADGSATTSTFTVTADGGETFGPFPAGTVPDPSPSEIEAIGTTFRFDVADSTGGNTGAVEVILLSDPPDG